jgi:DNA-binding MarR family transcriptional regulator
MCAGLVAGDRDTSDLRDVRVRLTERGEAIRTAAAAAHHARVAEQHSILLDAELADAWS